MEFGCKGQISVKILIAISGCHLYENNGVNQSQRDTWLPEATKLGIDYKFFHGWGTDPKPDVVNIDVDDSFSGVTEKLKRKLRYAYEHEYDYAFSCFADTYVVPDRLLASGFDRFDYFGHVGKGVSEDATFYCHGGAGYFVSRKAMHIAITNQTSYLNDDCWLGDVLSGTDTTMGHSPYFCQFVGTPRKDNHLVTAHMSDASHHLGVHPFSYSGHYMYFQHKAFLESSGDVSFEPDYHTVTGRHVPAIQFPPAESIRPPLPPPIHHIVRPEICSLNPNRHGRPLRGKYV